MESERENSHPEEEEFQIPVVNKNLPKNTEEKKEFLGGNYKKKINSERGAGKFLKEKILSNDALLKKLGYDQTIIDQTREKFKTGSIEEQEEIYTHIRREYVKQKLKGLNKEHPEAPAEILFLEDLISEEKTLDDLLPPSEDNTEKEVVEKITVLELKDNINELLATLPHRNREIMEMYYGLNGRPQMTLQEIGEQTPSVIPPEIYYQTVHHKEPDKITRERVRQIIIMTLRKLRNSKQINLIRDFW